MGAGASASEMTSEQELEVYQAFKKICADKLDPASEDQAQVFLELRRDYDDLVASVTGAATAGASGVVTPDVVMERPVQGLGSFRGVRCADRSKSVREKVLKGLNGDATNFSVGDIVSVKDADSDLCFEGVLSGMREGEMTVEVDFGDGTIESVPLELCRRVLPWTAIEVGDFVKAQPIDEDMRFDAVVTNVKVLNGNIFFDVAYMGCDETEHDLPAANVSKLASHRQSLNRFKTAVHSVSAVNFMRHLAAEHK